MSKEIKLNTNDIKKIAGMASKGKNLRYHLEGVRFYNGSMFATDGHALTLYTIAGLESELNDWLIPNDVVKDLPKDTQVTVQFSDDKNKCEIKSLNFSFPLGKVATLNIDTIIPKSKKTYFELNEYPDLNVTAFNPDLLHQAIKAHPEYRKNKTNIQIDFNDHLSPICCYIKSDSIKTLAAVIMPVRFN